MIPLSEPFLSGNEWTYIKECLDTNWVSSAGSYVGKFEEAIASYTHSPFAIATNSGTSALQLALTVANIQPGDIVLLPNLTFVATANTISYLGATPIFIDVTDEYWQLDVELLKDFIKSHCAKKDGSLIYKETRQRIGAIIAVHILGYMGNIPRLAQLTKEWGIPLIEDAAESLGSTFNGKHAGTIGDIGCLSFNGNKIITTGGGGMLLTANQDYARKAKHLSTQAKAPGIEYFHDEVGYNFRLVNILAAMGLAQMEKFTEILKRKRQIAQLFQQELTQVGFPKIHQDVAPNFWLNTFLTKEKDKLIQHLANHNIQSRPLWIPMSKLPMYKNHFFYQKSNISQHLYNHAISIPSSASLTLKQQQKVITTIQKFTIGSRYL